MIRIVNILSGGILDDGALPEYVLNRIDYVVKHQNIFDVVFISSRYSRNVPVKCDANKFSSYENEAILKELSKRKCQLPVYLESSSTDTVGSAIFGRLYIEQLYHSYELTVVTSSFHYRRSNEIYKWAFSLNGFGSHKFVRTISADNEQASEIRRLREHEHLEYFRTNWAQITDFKVAFKMLLEAHTDYNSELIHREILQNANY